MEKLNFLIFPGAGAHSRLGGYFRNKSPWVEKRRDDGRHDAPLPPPPNVIDAVVLIFKELLFSLLFVCVCVSW